MKSYFESERYLESKNYFEGTLSEELLSEFEYLPTTKALLEKCRAHFASLPAITDTKNTVTYGELYDRVAHRRALLDEKQIPAGGHVGVMCRNNIDAAEWFLAVTSSGRVLMMMPCLLYTASPCSRLMHLAPENTERATFFSESPIMGDVSSRQTMGTREGQSSVTVCPALFAISYPSPTDPVEGYDRPPVARITAECLCSPSPSRTPRQAPSSIIRDFTRECTNVPPPDNTVFSSAFTISEALSLTGKTRLPRSFFSGTPASSKNSMTSAGVNPYTALYRNFGLRITFFSISSGGQLFRVLPMCILSGEWNWTRTGVSSRREKRKNSSIWIIY